MTNTKVMDFFKAQEQREQEAKKAELQAMVETFGIDEVLATMLAHLKEIREAVAEVEAEEAVDPQFEEAKSVISATKYLQTTRMIEGKPVHFPVEFSSKTEQVFADVLKKTGTEAWTRGEGKRTGRIVSKKFAQYIIEASGNKADFLIDIINILKNAAWDSGHGITQEKMEIVYHTLVLHKDRKAEVIPVLTEILKNYDKTSLKVTANQDDTYRNHLAYKEKMMMWVEEKVCEQINATPLFNREATTA